MNLALNSNQNISIFVNYSQKIRKNREQCSRNYRLSLSPMADIEPPSFSLGLDLDLEFESEPQDHPLRTHVGGNEEDFHLRVSDSDLDEPTPTLRRLRRGGPSSSKPISTPSQWSERLPTSNCVADDGDDDDIQDFSSEELATTG